MPPCDSSDQEIACRYEKQLRHDAAFSANRWELKWFTAQPKRVRQSWALLCLALESAQAVQQDELVRADLSLLHINTAKLWQGIGGRKRRCQVFELTGWLFMAQQSATSSCAPASACPLTPAAPTRTFASRLAQTDANPVLTCPSMPEGLRDGIQRSTLLVALATGPASYGLTTPELPISSPPATVIHCTAPARVPPPEPFVSYKSETTIDGQDADWRVAWVVALGRHSAAPHRVVTLRRAAELVVHAEVLHPGVLDYLGAVFFPLGYEYLYTPREY
ncbi:hypothetical protein BDV93DRAFT_563883 [Ceratobasidium sp. AG-I]|nr:hypothetical protein BDV93DRAFT_563883 [Ceratobasidium sp. AG-I]